MAQLLKPFKCNFAPGGWNSELFHRVRSPYSDKYGEWLQCEDHIENKIPEGCTGADGLGKRGGEFYVSLVTKQKIGSGVKISSRMSFYPEMAPLLVFDNNLRRRPDGDYEFGKHIEVVIYNKGVNIWRHFGKDCNPNFSRAIFADFDLSPDTVYNVEATVKNAELLVTVDGRSFGGYVPELGEPFHFGVTACEGVNRFYDLSAEPV